MDDALDIARKVVAQLKATPIIERHKQNPAEAPPSDALKGYAVCLYSDLVGENLWIVADDEDAERLIEQGERRGAIYTRVESRLVTRIDDPEIVKQVHAFKREFNTRMLPPNCGPGEPSVSAARPSDTPATQAQLFNREAEADAAGEYPN